jgi:hypothetical protein
VFAASIEFWLCGGVQSQAMSLQLRK